MNKLPYEILSLVTKYLSKSYSIKEIINEEGYIIINILDQFDHIVCYSFVDFNNTVRSSG